MSSNYNGPIRVVLFDVDGVLTDGTLLIDSQGEALKGFNVRDGLAVALLRAHKIRCGVISGKSSPSLDYRIRQLDFDFSITGRLEKLDAYEKVKAEHGFSDHQVAFVGDDVVDFPLIGKVGRFYAPADAHALVLARADHIVAARGGHGVAREVAEHLLMEAGLNLEQIYQPLINQWGRFNAAQ